MQHKDDKEADVKLPPLVAGDKEETNISKLLSLDYQREWLEKRDTKLKNEKKKAKVGLITLIIGVGLGQTHGVFTIILLHSPPSGEKEDSA